MCFVGPSQLAHPSPSSLKGLKVTPPSGKEMYSCMLLTSSQYSAFTSHTLLGVCSYFLPGKGKIVTGLKSIEDTRSFGVNFRVFNKGLTAEFEIFSYATAALLQTVQTFLFSLIFSYSYFGRLFFKNTFAPIWAVHYIYGTQIWNTFVTTKRFWIYQKQGGI